MRATIYAHRCLPLILMAALTACGGGNSATRDSSVVTSVSSLVFAAASPDAPTPASQSFDATFGPGTIYLAVDRSGTVIADVSYTLSGNSAHITVEPAAPSVAGAGNLSGYVIVTAYHCANADCSLLASETSQAVSVSYRIPAITRFVAPYVGTTDTSGSVIIRGQGFQRFTVQNVLFGATPASTFSVVSDTELTATYPALAAGTYPVQIEVAEASTPVSTATLVVIDPPNYAATTLAYPTAAPQVKRLLYDAERQSLLLAVDSNGGEIQRYTFAGGWGAPATADIANLSDIALSVNGAELMAVSTTNVAQIDPSTLATATTSTTALATGAFFKNIAVANDDKAVVTTGYNGSTSTALEIYDAHTPGFSQPSGTPSLDNSTPVASGDGSLIAIEQGDTSQTTALTVYDYTAATGVFASTSAAILQNSVAPAMDRAATRIVLNGTNVYDGSFNLLGTLPGTTLAVVIKPDASRAYTFDSAANQVLSFDLTATLGGGAFPQAGSGVSPPGDPGSNVRMAISPDGGTLFLAGSSQIVIQPAPP